MIAIEDNIILEALEPEKLTSGGVILPDTSTEASDRGRVLQVGPGRCLLMDGKRMTMQAQVGDVVAYPKNLARKVEVNGEDFWVIREVELLMIIEREEK
jgi:chaperonin GroES